MLFIIITYIAFSVFKTFFYNNTNFTEKEYKLYIEPNTDFTNLLIKLDNVIKSSYYFSIASKNSLSFIITEVWSDFI